MPIEISVVTRPEDLRDIFRLRHEVFVEQEADLPARDNALLHDEFDAYSTTTHILARAAGAPVAALRVIEHSGVGLPWDHAEALTERHRNGEGPWGSVGMVVCRSDARRRTGLVMGVIRRGLQALRRRGVGPIAVAVNDDFARTVRRMGLETVGDPFRESGIRSRVVPMVGHLDRFAPPFDREFADDDLRGFTDPGTRLLYRRGEVIRSAGVHAATAFVVTRGAVRLKDPVGGDRVRRPGDPLGLAELVAGRVCSRTAFAAERGTELAPLQRAAILGADQPATLLALARQALGEDTWVEANPALDREAA